MRMVKYIGAMAIPSQTSRELDPASLERLGVEYKDGTAIWNPENRHVLEMTNAGGDALVEALPNEFKIVEEDELDDELPMPLTTLNPQGPSGGSVHDAPMGDDESSVDTDPA